jgi:glycosyltransferase involved in cell wall biosynthesis
VKGPLRIAVTADPELPVPPLRYGGIERIIYLLVEGLIEKGHHVVLFAHPDSAVSAELVPYSGRSSGAFLDVARNAATIVRRVLTDTFDVVHSFGRLASIAPLALHTVRKIMSYQRAITPSSVKRARQLFGSAIEFTACSRHMIQEVASMGTWHVVYNGVPIEKYAFRTSVPRDAPLMFLGRVEEIKGPHLAIEVARRAGRRLVIAGNVEPAHQSFFDERIRPFLDGERVTYVGPVEDGEKSDLLGRSAALLMPILWDEPFGIVMAEALSCGTPVIGLRRGSVPEVVTDGVTGMLASDTSGLVDAVARVNDLDRQACRRAAEERFSDRAVVEAYESLYRATQQAAQLEAAAVLDGRAYTP